jgi:hypothetical protein
VRVRGGADQPDTLPVETELGRLGTHELHPGADILGTVRIIEPDAFLDMLAEGGSGYHFLGRTAQKVVLVRRLAVGAVAA